MVVLRTRDSLQTVQIRLAICRLDMARQIGHTEPEVVRSADFVVPNPLQIGYGRHMGTVDLDGSYNL